MVSATGFKPNDLVYALNGLSIEVVDTDAEGRMVLADTLALASKAKPRLLLDFATLTGACVRALDTRRAGVFSGDRKLSARAVEVGEDCGERAWSFPIGEEAFEVLKSEHADIRQCAAHNNSDHIYAATFLSKFVEKGVDWVHMDLSCEENKGGLGLVPSTVTGFGVRWAVNFAEDYFKV
jgi:leucyl aminopeptidase